MIKYLSQCHPVSLLLALLLWQGSAHAQAEGQSSQPIISSQIEELKAEVQQLRQLIEQQQSALKAMQKRMDEREVASDAGAARSVPPGNVRADTGTAAPRQSVLHPQPGRPFPVGHHRLRSARLPRLSIRQ